MKRTQRNFIILCIIFSTCLIIANVIASKVINLNFEIGGYLVTLPCGIICYPITYLVTDIVNEIWGSKQANKVVLYGLFAQGLATILIVVAGFMPAINQSVQDSYMTILGQNWFFVIASVISYITSQFLDVKIFSLIRNKWVSKSKNLNKGKWIWNNLSTCLSQLVDTVVFSTIAFGFGFRWIFDAPMMLLNMILVQYIFKLVIALLDTPFFYLFTRKNNRGLEEINEIDENDKNKG